jgi:hypothetical protein
MRSAARRRIVFSIAGLLWIGVVVAGLSALMTYDNRPGAAAAAPASWPRDSALERDPNGPTLVMLAHPRCDCTRASLAELAELMARADRPPRAFVVFVELRDGASASADAALWELAQVIPGVRAVRDESGLEARRFGVQTSGQVLLYGASGALIYSGGATGSRGKVGDNAGRAAILDALATGRAAASNPVFGCELFAPRDLSAVTDEASHGPDAPR